MSEIIYTTTSTELTSVADAIRSKGNTSESLEYPDGFVEAIEAIEGGGTVQTRKIYDETYVGWGHVSWLDATGIARTGVMVDDELNMDYIEPQIGSLVSRLDALTPMANQNLQVVDAQTFTTTRPPATYYSYVWIVT